MYKSIIQSNLIEAIENLLTTRLEKGEDNFRQILGKEMENIYIPSTSSGAGDININDRKIEIKFCCTHGEYKKTSEKISINEIEKDFNSLLKREAQFFLIAFRIGTNLSDRHPENFINFKDMKSADSVNFKFDDIKNGVQYNYKLGSIFLSATRWHDSESIRDDKSHTAKTAKCYFDFESINSIERSSLLEVHQDIFIHTTVIGSIEDGVLCFLFCHADDIDVRKQGSPEEIKIKNKVSKGSSIDVILGYEQGADIYSKSCRKSHNSKLLEKDVPVYQIYE